MSEEELEKIRKDYESIKDDLNNIGEHLVKMFSQVQNVHALNYRVKDFDHLIAKIQRKETEDRIITVENYRKKITDLVGIRILHVFKDDWKEIDAFIRKRYGECFMENPKFYYRDPEEKDEERLDFDWEMKDSGYRSIHYLIDYKDGNFSIPVEIQVRTIFEEAWGEIDHRIVYPELTDDKVIKQYSIILNRLASLGDEIGLNLRDLKQTFEENKQKFQKFVEKNNSNDKNNQNGNKELDHIQSKESVEKKDSGFGAGLFTGVAGTILLNYLINLSKPNSEFKNESFEDKKLKKVNIDHIIPEKDVVN